MQRDRARSGCGAGPGRRPWGLLPGYALMLSLVLAIAGCKGSNRHTSDPQLRQIDELLNKQLPPGTPLSQVTFFVTSRGYPIEGNGDPRILVATVEHVDTKTLRPSAARVTFHFDTNNKLLTYDMVATTPTPVQ